MKYYKYLPQTFKSEIWTSTLQQMEQENHWTPSLINIEARIVTGWKARGESLLHSSTAAARQAGCCSPSWHAREKKYRRPICDEVLFTAWMKIHLWQQRADGRREWPTTCPPFFLCAQVWAEMPCMLQRGSFTGFSVDTDNYILPNQFSSPLTVLLFSMNYILHKNCSIF